MEQSKNYVSTLLGQLNTNKRTEIMSKLHGWFDEKNRKVHRDLDHLTLMEDERTKHDQLPQPTPF